MGKTKLCQDGWSEWLKFPDPRKGEYLYAPFGYGVYQLRNKKTGELVLYGRGKNLAFRMSSLLPSPYGAGNRDNKNKSKYVYEHIADIEYRTIVCNDEKESKECEIIVKYLGEYLFNT